MAHVRRSIAKLRRSVPAFLLLLAAFVPAAAAAQGFNPDRIQSDARRLAFDGQAFAACISAYVGSVDRDPASDDVFTDCRCAVDRYLAARGSADLPDIGDKNVEAELGPPYAQCAGDRAAGIESPPVVAAPAIGQPATPGGKPIPAGGEPAETAPLTIERPAQADGDSSLLGRLARAGLPPWALVAGPLGVGLALLVLLAIRGARRERDDLLGPPR